MNEYAVWIIVGLLGLIAWEMQNISSRLKNKFPTDKEEDYRWSQEDPHGHYEAHKDEIAPPKKG
jgi:hypothetical protein